MSDFVITAALINIRVPTGAARIVEEEAGRYLETLREPLLESVRSKMRVGVSAAHGRPSERDEVHALSFAGRRPFVSVEGTLVQTNVDERGRVPGRFPPFGPGSVLREWVVDVLRPDPEDVASVSFLVARAINRRGLPRPGDPLRSPFASTFAEWLPQVRSGLQEAGREAARLINAGATV